MKHIHIRIMLGKHYNDLKTYTLEQLKRIIKEVSSLSCIFKRSYWYVGPSFKEYYLSKFDNGYLVHHICFI